MTKQNDDKSNYRHTLIGYVPREWEVVSFESICVRKGLVRGPFGGTLKKEFFKKSGYKVYEQRNAIYRDHELGDYFIDETKYAELRRFQIRVGDFIVSCSGTIGKIFQIPNNARKGVINQALLKITIDDKKIDNGFFYQYFDWSGFQKHIIDNTQGGAMQNLVGMDIFKNLPFPNPPLAEQKAIAATLSVWDKAIEKTQQLIDQKELRKKALLQKLLTERKRLPGFNTPWKKTRLGELFNERNEIGRFGLPLLSITGDRGVILQSESEKRDNSNEDKSKYRHISIGDIGYNTMRMWQGRSALSSLEGIVSPAYTIITANENADVIYFSYLFKTPKVVHSLFRNSQGLVGDTLNCKFPNLALVKVKVPEKREQTAIANVLTTADKELKLLRQKLDALKKQKKGLMQKLLTGQIRVKH